MGRPKLLLRLGGKSLVRRAAETALAACDRVVVVVGAQADRMRRELHDLPVTIAENPDYEAGLSTSLRRGVEAAADADAVLVLLADQPAITPDHLRVLIEAWRRERPPIVACAYRGTVGPPAVFDRAVFGELTHLEGDAGAKILIAAHPEAVRIPLEEAAVDVDTPEDWARLQS